MTNKVVVIPLLKISSTVLMDCSEFLQQIDIPSCSMMPMSNVPPDHTDIIPLTIDLVYIQDSLWMAEEMTSLATSNIGTTVYWPS